MQPNSSAAREPVQTTTYYAPIARWLIRTYGAIGFVVWLSISGAHIATPWRVGVGVFAFVWLWASWGWMGSKAGVEVRAEGIRVCLGFRRRSAAWSEINAFRVRQPGAISPAVAVELTSGQLLRTGLVQGRNMRWKGGASKDIVGVLNTELEHARSSG